MAARAAAAAAAPAAAPQQPSEVVTAITAEGGAPPRLAVPDFIALSPDAETAAIAKTIGQVLWDDLNFEREFAVHPARHLRDDSARRRRSRTCRSTAGAS